jgi:hypothetical protein
VGADFFAEVKMRKRSESSADGFCGLIFQQTSNDSFRILKVRERVFAVTENPGPNAPVTVELGPTSSSHIQANDWNTLSLMVQGGRATIFINSFAVGHSDVGKIPGAVRLAVQSPSIPSTVNCDYRDFVARTH